ncbi:MAG: DEAD/DEAH box helicase [Acidimicrobiia bacterium]|nr:DEAD/DEAH box helicase [Acidimicrobiia bacterium]
MPALDRFSPATRDWFTGTFPGPTPAQEAGWQAIAEGGHTLIHAPTGSGKTLAAFLWALDRLHLEEPPPERARCRVLYVSPLKALAYDIERNLRAPLRGIANAAERLGAPVPELATAMRTGDTPSDERRRMIRHPPDILITTPESLYLMLTSQVREILASVDTVIVDEIHAVAATKRGSHLALSLERLDRLTPEPPQRIGLSATQRPLDRIGEFLAGGAVTEDTWTPRPVTIVDAPRDRVLDVEVVVPVDDMTRPHVDDDLPSGPTAAPPRRSIWPAMYPELLDLVLSHRSTILFANSRGLVERLAGELNALAGEEVAKAHHGSISREQRVEIEGALKAGRLRCVCATSSLELGVDMEAVDLVILVESPTSVARGLQRVGRAGHQVGVPSRAKVFPKHRGDLLEAALVVDRMHEGLIEETKIPENPLDVLAQQLVAMVALEDWSVDEAYDLVRGAAPYASLGRGPFDAVLDMLAGRFPSDDFAELRPRLVWDRVDGTLTARGNARMLAVTNPGTIPDRGLYRVVLPEGGRVGELDEEMVYESRVGDVFVLGSSTWQVTEITQDRVVVVPAPGEPAARMPFWKGDTLGRPLETGRALGTFIRELGALSPEDATETLTDRYRLERRAAANLVQFLQEEREATGTLPTDRTLVLQKFRDEIGDWRVVLLSPFGARIHAPWALAAARRIRERHGLDVDAVWSDDGIILRFPDADEAPDPAELLIEPDDVEALVVDELGTSALFAARFREAAGRALLLPRRRPGQRTPLWLQRRRATGLLEAARRYPTFPIVLEAYREVLREHFDLPALREVLGDLEARRVRATVVETTGPSPMASSLMFDFIASFMYEYDAPPAERRAMALTVDQALLRELLGEPELRDLLDPDAMADLELELQRLAEGRRARGADGVADLLGGLGPLTTEEVDARTEAGTDAATVLSELEETRRVVRLTIRGAERWAAVEDVARLRDALGVVPPIGLPEALLEPPPDPLGDVVGRFARTHGPFTSQEAADALGLPVAVVRSALEDLEERGRVTRGAFRPRGAGREWVDGEVLRRLRRRSLARLRSEVEAVDGEAYGRFLPAWHGIGGSGASPGRLLDVVRRLQGAAIPASILEGDVLGARLDYSPDLLDAMCATGEVVWIGRGPLGTRDGRVALYLRDQVPSLWWDPGVEPPTGERHDALRDHLQTRGASFFAELYAAAGGGEPQDTLDALWDLVWAGEVTNDTIAPLRAQLWGRVRRSRSRRPALPSSSTPPPGTGRWSLVSSVLAGGVSDTERARARAEQVLERHGIAVRDAVTTEGVPGGFAGLYPVFSTMEDAGRVRRGYFVEGLGGSQFALPGALDRLRTTEDTGTVVLAAADPANPYGAALGWPDHDGGRPSRSAGAHVVLVDGALAAFVERGGRTVLTWPDTDPGRVAAAVAGLGDRRIRRLVVETVDGVPAADTALGRSLVEAGFAPGYKGLAHRRA